MAEPVPESAPPVLAEIVRSGFVESRHRGSLVELDADGSIVLALGDVRSPVFPRSSLKTIQASAMVGLGLELPEPLLALAASSHSAESFHLDGVRRILTDAGLDEAALETPPDLPLDEQERERFLRADRSAAPIVMNCSGKHAAMLATCVTRGWSLRSYLSVVHPLQIAIRRAVAQHAQEAIAATGTDGCGLPQFAISLLGLARAYRAHVRAEPGTPERRVADAMRAHPLMVGGTRRDDSHLMAGVSGLLAKNGAEGVYALALADGRAAALKIEDGGLRASVPVAVASLRRMGVAGAALDALERVPLRSGRDVVGEIRALPMP